MLSSVGSRIRKVDVWPVDIGLTDDFVISQGAIEIAENAFVRIVLENGIEGYGELAPFEELTGETRDDGIVQMNNMAEDLPGRSVMDFREIGAQLEEKKPGQSAPRCALETAMMDAYCRMAGIPLWALWCKSPRRDLMTDITIPILSYEKSMELAKQWHSRGFRTLKMKVGIDEEAEFRLISDIHALFPDVSFIIDANMGFQPGQAIEFVNGLTGKGLDILLFEQPNDRFDLEGLKRIRENTRVPVAADEAVFNVGDALQVIEMGAADVINLKIMKSGVIETVRIIEAAVSAGVDLMIGGMVETRIGMGCSFALARSFPAIKYLDLDTPLLMSEDPVRGGYRYEGPRMIGSDEPGLGILPLNSPV
jgi:L-alanine-DL-glutamate epimerase-like enolase superfamily enzyme